MGLEAATIQTIKTIATVAAGTAAVGGTVYSVQQGREARSEQREANRKQENLARAETRRRQLEQVARMRAIRAAQVNVAEQTGVGSTSTLSGATAAIGASAAGNIGLASAAMTGQASIYRNLTAAGEAAGQAQLGGTIATLGNQAFAAMGGYDKLFETKPDAFTQAKADLSAGMEGFSDLLPER